jgi:hypothetical protein
MMEAPRRKGRSGPAARNRHRIGPARPLLFVDSLMLAFFHESFLWRISTSTLVSLPARVISPMRSLQAQSGKRFSEKVPFEFLIWKFDIIRRGCQELPSDNARLNLRLFWVLRDVQSSLSDVDKLSLSLSKPAKRG